MQTLQRGVAGVASSAWESPSENTGPPHRLQANGGKESFSFDIFFFLERGEEKGLGEREREREVEMRKYIFKGF